jgi:hypothetical protein
VGDSYLIMKCIKCGSISHLAIKSVRSAVSLCPVCGDGEIKCRAIQPTILMYLSSGEIDDSTYLYNAAYAKFSVN